MGGGNGVMERVGGGWGLGIGREVLARREERWRVGWGLRLRLRGGLGFETVVGNGQVGRGFCWILCI